MLKFTCPSCGTEQEKPYLPTGTKEFDSTKMFETCIYCKALLVVELERKVD